MMTLKQFLILIAACILPQPGLDNFARWVVSDAELQRLNDLAQKSTEA